nr:hypothetical protein [Halovivax sp. KZCA124]
MVLDPPGDEPAGLVQKPGVGARPFGPSPLKNHVPRDWATSIPDDVFIERVRDECEIPDHTPTFDEIRDLAGSIYVRGSVRYRRREHYLDNIGRK